MTKSELIDRIAGKQTQLSSKDVELAVKAVLEYMSQVLAEGGRIEIRGFGSFSLHYRVPRIGRNPKTGTPVALSGKYVHILNLEKNCVIVSTTVCWLNSGSKLNLSKGFEEQAA